MDAFVENSIKAIREKVGNGKVLCALSGVVDSSVAAVMLAKADRTGHSVQILPRPRRLHSYGEDRDQRIHR